MNIFLKVYLIGAPTALLLWIMRATVLRLIYAVGLIGGALLDVGCQAYIDITGLFKREKKTTEPEEFEKFYHE